MRQKDAKDYDADLAEIARLLGGHAITGKAMYEVIDALDENRDGTLALAARIGRNAKLSNPAGVTIVAVRNGEHKQKRMRVMSTDEGTGPPPAARADPAEALRRLYDAKIDQLRQVGVPEPQRIRVAVDYACGEIWRCSIGPMPVGGIGKLEDDLYRAIGCDRFTGVRFAPQ